MCLETLSSKKPKSSGVGWKEFFRTHNRRLCGQFFTDNKPRPVGRWLNEKGYRSRIRKEVNTIRVDDSKKRYPRGWHIWTEQPPQVFSTTFVVRKVKYTKALVLGSQGGKGVIVAKYIFILKSRRRRLRR